MAKVSEKPLLDSDDDDDLQDSAQQIDEIEATECSTLEQISSKNMDLEDIFDQSDKKEQQQAWKHFEKYTSNFYRAGFREAVTVNEDEREGESGGILQQAFDSGYSTAFVVGKLFGNIRATLTLTKGIYDEGRLTCTPEQMESLNKMYQELLVAQEAFTKYVEEQRLLGQLDQHLLSGSFSTVEQINTYWNKKIGEIFDLEDFAQRLRTLLSDMKCPWSL